MTISLFGLLPHFHKITHHWTDSINSAQGNPSTSGCITHSISAAGYSKHYTLHQDYQREAERGREEGKKALYPSCHDAPVIVTDQIQCSSVCVRVKVCVSPVPVCKGCKLSSSSTSMFRIHMTRCCEWICESCLT